MPAMKFAINPRGLSSVGGCRSIVITPGRTARVVARRAVVVRADSVDDAVNTITSGVQAAGSAAKSALGAAQTAAGFAKQAADVVAPIAKTAAEKAAPVAKDTASAISKAASPAVKSIADKVPSATQELDKALSAQGINAKPVVSAGTQAVEAVKPAATGFFSWFLAQPLLTQAETVGLAAFTIYFGPSIFGFLAGALQGYRGDITPAGALNTLTTDSSSILVDIRRVSEKEASGVPVLPGSASKRTVELEFDFTEDKKVRNLLANAEFVEAQVTALKIAALKRTKKGSPLILLDKNGSSAKVVAKELAKRAFGKVFVIAGGFDGRNGWVQSKLQVDVAKTVSTATVVKAVKAAPARKALPQVTPSIAPSMTISSKTASGGSRSTKSLPPPKK